jgi:hypothetical protein
MDGWINGYTAPDIAPLVVRLVPRMRRNIRTVLQATMEGGTDA